MNKICLIGRLTRDPEVRYGTNGAVARYNLAVDRRIKREGEPEADFFPCTVFGKGAEFAEKHLKQGIKIAISGRMENDNYTDKNGNKVYSWRLIVEEQEFAESKNSAGGNAAPKANNNTAADGYMDVPDTLTEELPFV